MLWLHLSSVIQGRKEYPAYSNTLGVLQRHQRVVVISLCNSNTLRCEFLPTLGTLGAELSVSQKIGFPEYLDLSCNSNPYMTVGTAQYVGF